MSESAPAGTAADIGPDEQYYLAINEWSADAKTTELQRYTAHAAVLTQATAFLTHITTTAGLYATITGAAWTVVSANTLAANKATLISLLGLHIAFSIG